MVVIICDKYGNNRSRTENVTERTRFSKLRLNDLEDIGQSQRSSHATHLMLLIICTKYVKNPSRTVEATERTRFSRSRLNDLEDMTRFSRSRLNDLEDISQGHRSLYATHPLILVIICAKYRKNLSRTVDFFFSRSRPKNFKNSNFQILTQSLHATHPLMIVIICAKYQKNPCRTVNATERTQFSKSRPNDLEDIGQGQRSLCATHPLMVVIICG